MSITSQNHQSLSHVSFCHVDSLRDQTNVITLNWISFLEPLKGYGQKYQPFGIFQVFDDIGAGFQCFSCWTSELPVIPMPFQFIEKMTSQGRGLWFFDR
ncbi:hypothetical protein L683_20385 [Pseudomonas aeruginosa WC55]|nr:hypothetical protein L683_20385 [Pseudomonas aeruginosa WC55]KWX32014.1 hypothetical protein AW882_09570 [Pseudomonas aeruginosa]KWX35299.1 hypothetical protein AW883_09570 [Pseudomonas aeruginosa]KWX36218.1 hypothetical protein AW880_09605 [Pseudomonas aeruginosa]KWX48542.1 hypothetical protein AW884_09570 [Pseudomonas aeruginosa]